MKGKVWLKRILLMAVVVVIAVVIRQAMQPTPTNVESSVVKRGAMRVTIDAEGKTRVHDRFVVAAPIAGKISRISLHRGDWVESGTVVAKIEPPPLAPLDPRQLAEARARVAKAEELRHEAEIIVEHARTDCEQARREYERAEKLVESGDIPKQEFERLRNAEKTCRQQLEATKFKARAAASEVEVAKAALIAVERAGQSNASATVVVRAPVRGRVLRVLEESERVVAPGTPLLELSSQSLEVVVDVLSTDAVKIKPGAAAFIEGWGGDHAINARVRLVEPSGFTKVSALGIEEQRVNVIADFVEAFEPLGDGYRVEANLVIWEADNVLKIPASALFRQGQNWSVFVIENGQAKLRGIEIGHRNAFEAGVLKGLQENETVILHPASEVKDGLLVRTNNGGAGS
jgi:HlyD family secretion protein